MTMVKHRNKEIKVNLDVNEVFDFLVDLRNSGITNMWGASPYIEGRFDCSPEEASYWLTEWIKTFRE